MDVPLFRKSESADCPAKILTWLLGRCAKAGISRIVLPFVDVSRIANERDYQAVVTVLRGVLPLLEDTGLEIHLETDLPPHRFAELLDELDHPKILVNYDSGNSASLGYDPKEEFTAYGTRVGSVHIKDRLRRGGTVPLGQGHTDFVSLFAELARVGYKREYILQVARGQNGQEIAWARANRAFVERRLAELSLNEAAPAECALAPALES
jgi:L-ribulose-5-phosphate 3-epimerase